MSPITNHILMTICEESFDYFTTTKYTTYCNYCNSLKWAFIEGRMNMAQRQMIAKVNKALKDIYAMNDDEIGKYIYLFFTLKQEVIIEFEKVIRTMKVAYPMSRISK